MKNDAVFAMKFAKVYPLLVAKAGRKGRTRAEVDAVTAWLTGYTPAELEQFLASELTYGEFFERAPHPNENRRLITAVSAACGWRRLPTRCCGKSATWTSSWTNWPKAGRLKRFCGRGEFSAAPPIFQKGQRCGGRERPPYRATISGCRR